MKAWLPFLLSLASLQACTDAADPATAKVNQAEISRSSGYGGQVRARSGRAVRSDARHAPDRDRGPAAPRTPVSYRAAMRFALLVVLALTAWGHAEPAPVFAAHDKIRYAAKTVARIDGGSTNADYFSIIEDEQTFLVANGSGATGAAAAKAVSDRFGEFFTKTADENATWPYRLDHKLSYLENRLAGGLRWANEQLNANKQRATAVVALINAGKTYIANIGLDRAYLFREGKLTVLSHDHTLIAEYRRDHPDTKLDQLPRKDAVTRELGRRPTVDVDPEGVEIRIGDKLVLCSEGLAVLGESTIASIVAAHGAETSELEATVAELIDRTTPMRKTDVTVIVIGFVRKPN